jgi:hypothetical protein
MNDPLETSPADDEPSPLLAADEEADESAVPSVQALEARQDEVLARLDELTAALERLIAQCTAQRDDGADGPSLPRSAAA